MFITSKRHQRELQELLAASNRLSDALLMGIEDGLFLLDATDRILPQVSKSLGTLFRRRDFANLSFEKLIGPIVTAKTLGAARSHVARLLAAARDDRDESHPLRDVEVRLPNPDGTCDAAHYSFEFSPVHVPGEARVWLVRVSDITARAHQNRELEDLRTHARTQGEVLRSILQGGSQRFAAFLQRTDASMKAINAVLKKPAREADAFRNKLEETLVEVDRVRRDSAALKLTAMEAAARLFEDSLHELRSRGVLSGSDFLPLAIKLDELYGQFALIRQLTVQSGPVREPESETTDPPMTENGTQIIEAPKFAVELNQPAAQGTHRMAQAGSLESTLAALTELVAQENGRKVTLQCTGIQLVPPRYQATVKNVAVQLIRNAVIHGIESAEVREAANKPAHGTLHIEFKVLADQSFEMLFDDDGRGLDPDKVRRTAIAKGLITADAATRLRDRQAIKLIFKSGYSTLPSAAGATPHGTGMSLVRRYVQESGGKIALASLLGHETRFKIMLPAEGPAAAQSQVA